MKHQYDDKDIQPAIDAALENTDTASKSIVTKFHYPNTWKLESKARLSLLKTALDLLPEPPPPVVDGKTPGQVACDAGCPGVDWEHVPDTVQNSWEAAASAVLAAFGNKPQFDFTTEELAALDSLCETQELKPTQVMRQALRCYQMSVQGQTQPAEIPWTEWPGGPCPLKDEEVEEWEYENKFGAKVKETTRPSILRWRHANLDGDIIAYRVTKWREGFGPVDWKAKFEAANEESRKELIEKVETVDPYATLKAAHAEGKVIQILIGTEWRDVPPPLAWTDPIEDYRIKPTPETFIAHGKEWTRHVPGDPMPETKGRSIEAIDRSGSMYATKLDVEHKGFWTDANYSNPFIGWRYADEPTPKKPVKPWTPAVGDVVTLKSGGPKMTVSAVGRVEVQVHGFKGESLVRSMLPIATLIPAQP